jgi:alpha-D-xyloside xylohydrolase
MRYRLMPYIYAQAKHSVENGLPLLRALFVEYPDDPGAWLVDDQYLFGSDILVAPMLENTQSRDVYLPGNHKWIDYQTGKTYASGWNRIEAGEIPVVMLVRDGAVIPHINLAQSTMQMDWSELELKVFSIDTDKAEGMICLPSDNRLEYLELDINGTTFRLKENPLKGKAELKVSLGK